MPTCIHTAGERITALRARGGDRGTALPGMHTGDAVGVDLVPGKAEQ